MREEDKIVLKRRSEKIYNMMEVNSYRECIEIPGNKEFLICEFKQN